MVVIRRIMRIMVCLAPLWYFSTSIHVVEFLTHSHMVQSCCRLRLVGCGPTPSAMDQGGTVDPIG